MNSLVRLLLCEAVTVAGLLHGAGRMQTEERSWVSFPTLRLSYEYWEGFKMSTGLCGEFGLRDEAGCF